MADLELLSRLWNSCRIHPLAALALMRRSQCSSAPSILERFWTWELVSRIRNIKFVPLPFETKKPPCKPEILRSNFMQPHLTGHVGSQRKHRHEFYASGQPLQVSSNDPAPLSPDCRDEPQSAKHMPLPGAECKPEDALVLQSLLPENGDLSPSDTSERCIDFHDQLGIKIRNKEINILVRLA